LGIPLRVSKLAGINWLPAVVSAALEPRRKKRCGSLGKVVCLETTTGAGNGSQSDDQARAARGEQDHHNCERDLESHNDYKCSLTSGSRQAFFARGHDGGKLFLAARQDGFEVRRLFFAGNDANFNFLETGVFEPVVQIAFGNTQPTVAVKFVCAVKIMFHQIQNPDVPAGFRIP